jgi:hypothetical protein
MRYELTDHEWTAIKPMLPNKPRGVTAIGYASRPSLRKIFLFPPSSAPGSGTGYPARAVPVGAGEPCTKWLVRNH